MRKLTVREVADKVDSEGLDYAILYYMRSDSIEDQKLAELWDRAGDVLKEIEQMLEAAKEDEVEEDEEDEE